MLVQYLSPACWFNSARLHQLLFLLVSGARWFSQSDTLVNIKNINVQFITVPDIIITAFLWSIIYLLWTFNKSMNYYIFIFNQAFMHELRILLVLKNNLCLKCTRKANGFGVCHAKVFFTLLHKLHMKIKMWCLNLPLLVKDRCLLNTVIS